MLQEKFEIMESGVALVRNAGAGFTAVTRGLAATGTAGVARTGAGVYTATLAQGIPAANCRTIATLALSGDISVAHTSDTVKTITIKDSAVAAADIDFDVSFGQVI